MRRSVFCNPSISVEGVSPISQIWSPGRRPARSARLPASTLLTAMTPLMRSKRKSIRSNEERLRWNDANAPMTIATVSNPIRAFVRMDLRMVRGRDIFNAAAAPKSLVSRWLQTGGLPDASRASRWFVHSVGFDDRKSARIAQKANVAVFFAPLAAAEIEDAEAAESEVVTDRIGWIEASERVGDLARGLPVGGLARVEAEKGRDAVDVRVDRHQQFRRIDERPDAEVGGSAADHPAEKEVHALARGAVFR